MRRRSSGEVAAKKVMTSIFSCWGRIALTVALLGWHFMSTLSARSVFHEQPETMNNDKKKHVHCTIFGVQHNVLAFLRPTRKNVLKPRAWICWSKTMRSGGKKATDWNKRCNLKQKERKLWSRIRDGNQIQRRMWKQNTNANKNTNTNTKNKTRGRVIVAVQYTNWSRAGIWDNKVKSVGSNQAAGKAGNTKVSLNLFFFTGDSQFSVICIWTMTASGALASKATYFLVPSLVESTAWDHYQESVHIAQQKWIVAEIRSVTNAAFKRVLISWKLRIAWNH